MIIRRIAAVALGAATLLAVAVAPADATAASVSLAPIHTSINSGDRPGFTFYVHNAPSGSHAYLQRQFGSAHVWKTVVNETALSGSTTAPALTTGVWVYRMIATNSAGTLIASSVARKIAVYGRVPMSSICANAPFANCSSGTEQVGGGIYTYAVFEYASDYPSFNQDFQFGSTSCKTLVINFAADSGGQSASATEYLKVVQSASDPVTVTDPPAYVRAFSVHMDGGPFYIDASSDMGYDLVFNGYGDCYTTTGQP